MRDYAAVNPEIMADRFRLGRTANGAAYSTVIVRESGRSSIPETAAIDSTRSEGTFEQGIIRRHVWQHGGLRLRLQPALLIYEGPDKLMSAESRWIDTSGGPHLLLAEELLPFWRGIEGWRDHRDPSDASDYARACRASGWLGAIPCHTGEALVLSGDCGPIAWIPNTHQDGGTLVQWIGVDDEASIADVLAGKELENVLDGPSSEEIEFSTSSSGVLRLFDSAERGDRLEGGSETIRLLPGRYRVRAGYFETRSIMIVVRRIARI